MALLELHDAFTGKETYVNPDAIASIDYIADAPTPHTNITIIVAHWVKCGKEKIV